MTIPFKRLRVWTDPDSVIDPGFAQVSYALFYLDRGSDGTPGPHAGHILATRSPDGRLWCPGTPLPDLSDLTEFARHFLATGRLSDTAEVESLFVWTRTGLGLLTRRHALTADLGLLLHIHMDPLGGARLLSNGAFAGARTVSGGFALSPRVYAVEGRATERDMPTYAVMNRARITLAALFSGFAPPPTVIPGRPTAVPLSAVFAMADFAGCSLTLELDGHPITREDVCADPNRLYLPDPEPAFIACHSPQVLEVLLLGLFSEVRTYSRDRSAVCRMTSGRLRAAPSLSLDYESVSTLTPPESDAWLDLRTHLTRVADFHGMTLSAAPLPLFPSLASPSRQTVTLDWLADPALLPTSDLKAHLYLRDEDEDD